MTRDRARLTSKSGGRGGVRSTHALAEHQRAEADGKVGIVSRDEVDGGNRAPMAALQAATERGPAQGSGGAGRGNNVDHSWEEPRSLQAQATRAAGNPTQQREDFSERPRSLEEGRGTASQGGGVVGI